jgi:hypothetical protein
LSKQAVVQIDYTPRPLQLELHQMLDQNRFNVLVMHRRFGKTVCAINHLIHRGTTISMIYGKLVPAPRGGHGRCIRPARPAS